MYQNQSQKEMKMKKLYIVIAAAAICGNIYAQQYAWAKTEGLYAYDYGYGIQTDNAGNVYVAGKYEDDKAMFSGTEVGCSGNHDAFLAKYGADGSLKWIKTAGGPDGDYAQTLYTDGTNFVYMGGEIEGYGSTITFPGSTITLTGTGNNDAFFAKYDLDGNLLWAKSFGVPANSEKVLAIAADGSQNVYIAGYFSTSTKIEGNDITGYGGRDIYIAKYDKDGVFQWFKHAGSANRDEVKGIRCDSQGNIYICGWMSDDCNFGSITLNTYKDKPYADAFLAKYSPAGDVIWAKSGGSEWDDVAWSLVFDIEGNIYMTGEFNAYAEFSPDPLHHLTTSGSADIFVVSYNQAGNVRWVRRAGSKEDDRARGIGTDGETMFVTGQIGGKGVHAATFGNASVMSVDTSDVFIAAINGSGDWRWATTVGGVPDKYEPLGYESGIAVTGHSGGNVYATGGVLCDPTPVTGCQNVFGSHLSTAYTRTDIFVAKITWDGTVVSIRDNKTAGNVKLIPNPTAGQFTLKLDGSLKSDVSVCVFDCTGRKLQSRQVPPLSAQQFDLSAYPDGVYFVETTSGHEKAVQKLVIQH
jgi:hypothetical protein